MLLFCASDAGEKITLSMLNSLAINVFVLLVFKLLPPTSSSIPLISRYLLFTFLTNMARTFTHTFTVCQKNTVLTSPHII